MARTPISKILETIEEVATIQDQLISLEKVVEALAARVEAIERAYGKARPTGISP